MRIALSFIVIICRFWVSWLYNLFLWSLGVGVWVLGLVMKVMDFESASVQCSEWLRMVL